MNAFVPPVRRNTDLEVLELGPQVQEVNPDDVGDLDISGLETMRATVQVQHRRQDRVETILYVDRDYLPMVSGNNLRAWVRTKYEMEGVSEEMLSTKIAQLQKEKTEIRKMAREYIHFFFVEALKNKGIVNVKTMTDIKKYWTTNTSSDTGIEIIKYVLFGYFEEKKIGISY